jgi:hypothetical protein
MKIGINEAKRLVANNASGLIAAMDLEQLCGNSSADIFENAAVLEDAQRWLSIKLECLLQKPKCYKGKP